MLGDVDMKNRMKDSQKFVSDEANVILLNKIYESFEALEETLGGLKLEEPLFITYAAKKAFAQAIFNKDNLKVIKR